MRLRNRYSRMKQQLCRIYDVPILMNWIRLLLLLLLLFWHTVLLFWLFFRARAVLMTRFVWQRARPKNRVSDDDDDPCQNRRSYTNCKGHLNMTSARFDETNRQRSACAISKKNPALKNKYSWRDRKTCPAVDELFLMTHWHYYDLPRTAIGGHAANQQPKV